MSESSAERADALVRQWLLTKYRADPLGDPHLRSCSSLAIDMVASDPRWLYDSGVTVTDFEFTARCEHGVTDSGELTEDGSLADIIDQLIELEEYGTKQEQRARAAAERAVVWHDRLSRAGLYVYSEEEDITDRFVVTPTDDGWRLQGGPGLVTSVSQDEKWAPIQPPLQTGDDTTWTVPTLTSKRPGPISAT